MFFLDQQSQSQGPVTLEQLQAMLADGRVSGSTLVWEDGMPQWTALAEHLQRVGGPQQQRPAEDAEAAQLRAFQAEVQALETGSAGAAADDRPSTPEEKSFVDDDGTAYTWDPVRRCFVPHQLSSAPAPPSYALEDMTMPDEPQDALPAPPPAARPPVPHGGEEDGAELTPEQIAAELEAERLGVAAKRRRDSADVADEQPSGKEARQGRSKKAAPPAKVNTSVYVTGIPDDATEAELAAVFAKCGLVKENDDGTPKVKLYRDKATGQPKGDALVTYLKPPSVALALSILDGAQFRLGGSWPPMSVTEAKFEDKGPGQQQQGGKKDKKDKKGGSKPKGKKGAPGADAALGWDGFDDVAAPKRVVLILRGMFAPEELRVAGALEELRADIGTECGKCGTVELVRVFEHHPEGVVSVKFREPADADACRVKMHGRWFGGRQLSAAMYDGRTDFDVHRPRTNKQGETEEEQLARLERFARELEEGEDGATHE